MKIEQKAVIWYQDLEDLIEETYGARPDIQAGELSNGSYIDYLDFKGKMEDGGKHYIHEEMKKELDKWLEEKPPWTDLEIVLFDLIKRGIIPEDDYLITIYW